MATATLERVRTMTSLRTTSREECVRVLGVNPKKLESLPFALSDITAGSETELQAGVLGGRHPVDLPRVIEESNYFANVARRVSTGELPVQAVSRLEKLLESNGNGPWPNSWVRVELATLGGRARRAVDLDLRTDAWDAGSGYRSDLGRFFVAEAGGERLRIPISYLVRLALLDIGDQAGVPTKISQTAIRLSGHFLNDNTSPETISFRVVGLSDRGRGCPLARETSKRYLPTDLLARHANLNWGLQDGQRVEIHCESDRRLPIESLRKDAIE